MPRPIPDDRFERLVEVATGVFIRRGYQRAQMDEIARELGVAKGTLYLYVESKEALFDLVARWADASDRPELPASLPVPTPPAGATLAFARDKMAKAAAFPRLLAALSEAAPEDAAAELRLVARELFRALAANRIGIKLLDRSAVDHPELAELWFKGGREGVLAMLERYLQRRIDAGALREVPKVSVAARLILETIAFWAVHRHWDPHPQRIDESSAEETVVEFVVRALAKE